MAWALQNIVLLHEARGKSHAVHKQMLRRCAGQIQGRDVMTKAKLRSLLEREDTARALIGSISTMGRDVRSTPMQWNYEGKKLIAALHFFALRCFSVYV